MKPVFVKYNQNQDPVKLLEEAMQKHGEDEAFILIPAALWNRIKPKEKEKWHEKQEQQCGPWIR